MMRQPAWAMVVVLASSSATATARAQPGADENHPFAAGALMVGPLGFARPPVTSSFLGGYAYTPAHGILIGGQGGSTVTHANGSKAIYGLATLGYVQTSTDRWQAYPFGGIGVGTMRASAGRNTVGFLFGAGLGADLLVGASARTMLIGCRMGYLAQSTNDDESIAYLAIAFGAGGRRAPPLTVARR